MWLTIAKAALGLLLRALSNIPQEKWAEIGRVIVDWLTKAEAKLPADHPMQQALRPPAVAEAKIAVALGQAPPPHDA